MRDYFNPRSHERSDTTSEITGILDSISIHAPTRGATVEWLLERNHISISIHAPTRGATIVRLIVVMISLISIHAPTRGATIYSHSCPLGALFQSTLPREERQSWRRRLLTAYGISIHAPTRGATYKRAA